MTEPDLFEGAGHEPPRADHGATDSHVPLATRMRPRSLDEFQGQEHLLGDGMPLRRLIERDAVGNTILWGPPGTGKTTLVRIIANNTRSVFIPFSAVTEGVPRIREVVRQAEALRKSSGRPSILFVDEVHHFSRSQQDTFLPHVEAGTITLIGATTQNPSFELNGALLSRASVYVLEPLEPRHIRAILHEAVRDAERGLGGVDLDVEEDAYQALAEQVDGDARRALNALEIAAELAGSGGVVTLDLASRALQQRLPRYDKSGEEHFNLISAFHKSVRGSDPHAAMYWLARMLEAGEQPRYILRRLAAIASEDVGLADPQALPITMAALQSFEFLGPPEGYLPIAEATIYLATAPKSNRSYAALKQAMQAARKTPAEPVPMHLRNAPSGLLAELGYHQGYQYPFDRPEHYSPQDYLPDALDGLEVYTPSSFGFEKKIAERLAWWNAEKDRRRGDT